MLHASPRLFQETLAYEQHGQERSLRVGTPEWYQWLTTASLFTVTNSSGTFTARKERAGSKRGGWYWKMYHRQNGKLRSAYLPDVHVDIFLGGMENILVDENEQTGVAHLIQVIPPGLGAPILHLHRSDEEAFLVLAGELTVFYGTPEEKRSQTLQRLGRVRIPAGTAHGVMNQGKENAILLVTFKVMGKPISKGFHRWFPRAAECGENIPAAFQLAIKEYDSAFVEQPGGH